MFKHLSPAEPHAREVEINLAKTLFTTFKAHVVSDKGKKSRVVCYISPRVRTGEEERRVFLEIQESAVKIIS